MLNRKKELIRGSDVAKGGHPALPRIRQGSSDRRRELDIADFVGFSEPVPAAGGTYEAWWFVFLGCAVG
jgi:hypothetical protein